MKPKTSPIWNYFVPMNESSAKCKICKKVYSRKGRTTTALKSHLKSLHPEKFEEFKQSDEGIKQLAAIKEIDSSTSTVDVKKLMMFQECHKNDFWDSSHQKSQVMDNIIAEEHRDKLQGERER